MNHSGPEWPTSAPKVWVYLSCVFVEHLFTNTLEKGRDQVRWSPAAAAVWSGREEEGGQVQRKTDCVPELQSGDVFVCFCLFPFCLRSIQTAQNKPMFDTHTVPTPLEVWNTHLIPTGGEGALPVRPAESLRHCWSWTDMSQRMWCAGRCEFLPPMLTLAAQCLKRSDQNSTEPPKRCSLTLNVWTFCHATTTS